MSATVSASQAPVLWFDALRVGDSDDTRAKDWTLVIQDPDIGNSDFIAQIMGVAITRRDRVAMSGLDLTCQSYAIDVATKLLTTLTFRKGIAGVTYIVTTTILTSSGTTLFRDAYIKVAPLLG